MRGGGAERGGPERRRSKRILKERDRLLRRLTAVSATSGAVLAAGAVAVPGAMPLEVSILVVVLAAFTAIYSWWFALRGGSPAPIVVGAVAGLLVAGFGGLMGGVPAASETAASGFSALAAASVAIPLAALGSYVPTVVLCVVTIAAAAVPGYFGADVGWLVLMTLMGWGAQAALGRVIELAGQRASRRIGEIARAHQTERAASEREAQRRQDARVLHDTVLATLSLLAHSGIGVGVDALRQQAGEDARLLAQLRKGQPLEGNASLAFYSPQAQDPERVIGATFEVVRQRFVKLGLEVNWHGAGRLVLPRETLDALIGALHECLENVRRHSGAEVADVTVTEDDLMVRTMVTDAGVGFDAAGVDPARLGFAESVVGRLVAVGGRARVFSSPGSGTTVMLEVPKP
ncbi:sensor histidine kinase [Agromyces seonyuensis]|uniref:Histidine kinase n=1 Tax=Agromyces seonyuensis TaxID=2662446 RepID=A0A6I4P5K3_9MICO|nr:ATP-binding protein [Agromyces seonyuensis]MWB98827.1 histidine kinase [Agromyces seonyuensis]